MKKNITRKISLTILALISVGLCTSCINEWTKNEAIEIYEPTLEEKNPELYKEYLELLRQYKKSDHKVVYVSFDNHVKEPVSRAHHIDVIPDSVDYVELLHPDNLVDREIAEMNETRTQKGTKYIYTISYAAMETEYLAKVAKDKESTPEGEQPSEPKEADFLSFINDYVMKGLAISQRYDYDGIILSYMGQGIINSTEAEIAIYRARQEAFINPIMAWANEHSAKDLIFEGRAYNLLDKAVLSRCKNIIVSTSFAQSVSGVEKILRMSLREDIPSDKFVVAVQTPNIDNTDDKTTGFFDGKSSILETSYWIRNSNKDYTVAGFAVYKVQNDFYSINRVYNNTRVAISTIN